MKLNRQKNNTVLLIILFSGAVNAAPFTNNGNGTITDQKTNLVWQKCSAGQNNDATCTGTAATYFWAGAVTYCNTLSLASRTWRLPSVNELLSVSDDSKSNPAIDTVYFPATVSNFYWSSTTSYRDNTTAWSVYFYDGSSTDYYIKTSSPYYVRCVSTGP